MPHNFTLRLLVATFLAFLTMAMRADVILPSAETSTDKDEPALSMPVHKLDSAETNELAVEIDNITFFKDNEFSGRQSKGYSLPGLWIQPKVTWQPLPAVRLEAGFHAAIFNGANKYPCYAYHDIGTWKGNQYQSGAHLLPFLRATAHVGNTTFVLGGLYGGSAHGLVEPLFNPEVDLTQDPETGVQIIMDVPRYHLDAWLNWQSYIFELDTHQEAFTVGVSQRIELTQPGSLFRCYVPLDVTVQHRGGEQDVTDYGVQTLCNVAGGIGLEWQQKGKTLQNLTLEVLGLTAWQQKGNLWPFTWGGGMAVTAKARMWRNFQFTAGLTCVRQFVSLYGSPFYSTVSQRNGGKFNSMVTPHLGAEWVHTFACHYKLGIKADIYPSWAGKLTQTEINPATGLAETTVSPAAFSNNFSFGIYLRCNPRFLLKKFSHGHKNR